MILTEKMSQQERLASMSLASIYGLRMLGMFLILPIFSIYASQYNGGTDIQLVGMALGAYPLTQALFQLPYGIASDKFGRKNMIYIGLLMLVLGSVVVALADNIYFVILGRAIQGAGAVSAAVTALLADLTREEHRTKAMAMIGSTIGVTFAISLVLGPAIAHWVGMSGIFWLTAVLASLAILVVKFVVPNPLISSFHSDASTAPAKLKDVLKNGQLLRLNYGIFALHAAQMAMFIVVPFAIQKTSSLDVNHHWQLYLPILIGSFILMIPAIIVGEKKSKLKQVFIGAVALMLVAQLSFAGLITNFWGVVFSLFAYFVAFNTLEASLPSLISKLAPAAAKGTAMGVYNTSQSLGAAVGSLVGGFLSHHYGFSAVFVFCAVLMGIWLLASLSMKTPPAVRTKMYHLDNLDELKANLLATNIAKLAGVYEAVAIAKENMLIVKVSNQLTAENQATIEQTILELIGSK
jgi:MFS family permease